MAAAIVGCAGGPGGGRIFKVPSGSMEPTLQAGERVIVAPVGSTPRVGDIVVFNAPEGAVAQRCERPMRPGEMCSQPAPKESSVKFVKRIVAGPGDELFLNQGHVYRRAAGSSRFVREQDPYIRACASKAPCTYPRPITVAPGHWFVLGDNRGESDDSRFWGPVPTGWIIGEAFATYWPLNRIGFF
jgi:signal peptidase I